MLPKLRLLTDPLAEMAYEEAKRRWERAVQDVEVYARQMQYWRKVLENDKKGRKSH